MTARWDDATDQAIRDALATDNPATALRALTQGCTEHTCRYHGAANRTLRTITNGEQE